MRETVLDFMDDAACIVADAARVFWRIFRFVFLWASLVAALLSLYLYPFVAVPFYSVVVAASLWRDRVLMRRAERAQIEWNERFAFKAFPDA